MTDKTTVIKRYYKDRDYDDLDMTIVDKVNTVIIEDYDDLNIEIEKSKVKVMIYGSFIIDCYDVQFVDITNEYDPIGKPLAVGIRGYDKARSYVKKVAKAFGYKFMEDILMIGFSVTDWHYAYYRNKTLEDWSKVKFEETKEEL